MSDVMEIVGLARRRTWFIKLQTKTTNAAGARVRGVLQQQSGSDTDQEAIRKRAGKIVAAATGSKAWREVGGARVRDVLAGQSEADRGIAELVMVELAAAAAVLDTLKPRRDEIEDAMRKAVRLLPAYAFAKSVPGLGDLGFAVLVGHAGDLAGYLRSDQLCKRLGLAPFRRDDGETRACSTWRMKGGLTAADWEACGYKPDRLGDIFGCVTDPLFRKQWRAGEAGATGTAAGRYGAAYAARRERTAQTHPEWSKMQAHRDALRVMTQRLVRDLWWAWRCEVQRA